MADSSSISSQFRLSFLPPLMVYLAAGVSGLTGIVGTFFVNVKEGGNPQRALNMGEFGASGLMVIAAYFIIKAMLPESWSYNGFE